MSRFVLTAQLQLQAPTNTTQIVTQMQQQLSKGVNVQVKVQQGKQATKTVQDLSKATKTAGDRAAAMGRSFAVSFKRFAAFSLATRTVGLFTRSLSDAVGEALDFERQLIKVAQVTGKSVSQLSDLTREVRSLAIGLGVSSQKLLEVSRVLAQAGLSADETRVALSALAKSALAATFDDIIQTTEGAVAIFNQFGQGAAALEGQLGSINAVAGQFAVEAGDLIAVIRRTGGVFKAAGGDLNELIALFTSVRATTRESAESIATGLRTIFTRIQRPSTIRFLEDLGIKLTDAEGKFVGGYKAIQLLSEALKNIPAGDLQFIRIAEQLGGFRQIGKIIPLLSQFGVAQEALNVALAGQNSLTKDAETAQGALLVRITALKEQFLEFVANVTKSPTFQILTNTAISLATALLKVADAVKVLAPLLTALTAIKIGGALSGFASGFLGGGKGPRAFNRGGLVPGTGNRDTVPAMLTPGEYVIRKSSVGKIGVDNLAAMNSGKRYASGGIVGQSKVGTVSADIFGSHEMKLQSQSASELFDKNPDNAFEFPGGYKKSSIKKSIEKRLAGDPQLPQALQSAKNVVSGAIGNLPKVTVAQGLDDNLSMAFDNALDDGILAAVNATATGFMKKAFGKGKDFKYKSDIPKDDMSKAFNAGAKGSIFEMVVASIAGAPLDNIKNTTMPFDFTSGIGKLSSVYDKINMPYVDAKLTGKASGKDVKVDPTTGDVQNLSKNVKPEELSKKVGNQFVMEIADEAHKAAMQIAGQGQEGAKKAFFGGAIKKYATGGAVSDTVPAMLTPGEYVINKDAAQSIGKGNLDRMNKRGVTGFAKGGAVGQIPGVQYLQAGGMAGGAAVGMAAIAMLPSMIEQAFGPMEGAMKAFFDRITVAVVMMMGLNKAFQLNKQVLTGWGAGVEMAKTKNHEQAMESVKAAAATAKETAARQAATAANQKNAQSSMTLNKEQMADMTMRKKAVATMAAQNAQLVRGSNAHKQMTAIITQGMSQFKASLNPKDFKVMQAGMNEVAASTDNLATKQAKLSQFMESFAASTMRGKSAEDAAVSAVTKTIAGEQKKHVVVQKATAAFQKVSGVVMDTANKIRKFGENLQTAAMVVGSLIMAVNIVGEMMKASAEKTIEDSIESGDFETGRGAVDSAVTGEMVAKSGQDAMMASIVGAALLGPFGAILAGVGTLLYSLFTFDAEGARQKQLEKLAKAEMTSLKDRQKVQLEAIKNAGQVTGQALTDLANNFKRNRELLANIINPDEQAKATKELDAAVLGAAASMGGLAKDQAHLDSIVQELTNSSAGLSTEIKDAAQSAFNLAQAAAQAAKANFDAAIATNTFNAASLGVENFVKSLESGSSRLGPAIKTLEENLKNFAMGDGAANIERLRGEALGALGNAGIGSGPVVDAINRQTDILREVADAQSKLPEAVKALEGNITAGMTDEAVKGELESTILGTLGVDRDSDIGRQMLAAIAKLDEKALSLIKSGSFDFTKFLEDANKGLSTLGTGAVNAFKAIEKHEATIAKMTKKRIDMEGKLLVAQRAAIDAHLEAAEIMAEFGGSAVTGEMRKQATLDKMNLATSRLGLGELTTGSAAELGAMSQAITAQFAELETRGRQPGAFAGGSGMDADRRKELQAAQKDLAAVTKQLIQLNREELEILKKKNALEKESLEAAIAGDLEKFLKDSMSVGATALIATGNEAMAQSLFGIEGVAGAFENVQKMQEDGVQSIFGQSLGGQGGVAERAAGAALGARGIEDPRMAALLAGTTMQEESLKAQNRALAGTLSTIADGQTTMAEMQVQSAQIAIDNANVMFSSGLQQANAQLLSRGGTVYAKDGIELFKPRGTDTVPAMLTPGEVVVNNRGANAGNNRSLLRRMNNGEAIGSGGQMGAGIDPNVVKQLITGLNTFNTSLAQNIEKLQNTKFQIKLDTTNVNVNLNGGSFLSGLKEELKGELMADVGEKIKTLRFDESGNASFSESLV
tara:strand:- start:8326 stop:14238 length:5913 start_codon:yes stop_codon:yes gene_type:complete